MHVLSLDRAYYNEFDPGAAEWLRELIRAERIPAGEVDERSILDVSADDLRGFTQCHFFAGIGGWPFALRLAGWPDDRPVWTGSPPCFPAGTLVLTRRGIIPIENVLIGDEVLTHEARWRAVTATGSEIADTVVVKGQGHFGLQCTPDHPFLTGRNEWTSAADLKGKHWATVAEVPSGTVPPLGGTKRGYFYDKAVSGFRVKGDKDGRPVYIGIFKTEQEAESARRQAVGASKIDVRGADAADPTSPAFAKFLGYWVGDGWVSRDDVFICGAREDVDLLTLIAADARIPVNVSITPTGARAYVGSKALSQWLREHFGEGADKKRLPAWLHSASDEYREAFLDGYWLADGHDETPKTGSPVRRFTTVSRALAIGVRILLNQSGKSASITLHRPNRQVSIAGRPVSERPFYRVTAYGAARSFRLDEVHGWGLVRSVEPSLRCRVYNLAVDGDESYTADGIVVHNCQPFSVAGKQKGRDDARHLAPKFISLVRAARPGMLFGEQVASAEVFGKAAKRARGNAVPPPQWAWLDDLLNRLEAARYAVGASDFPSAGVGAPHIRQRTFFGAVAHEWLADRDSEGRLSGAQRGIRCGQESPGAWYGEPERLGDVGGLVHSIGTGLEGHGGHGDGSREPGRLDQDAPGSVAAAGSDGRMADSAGCGWREERQDGRGGAVGDRAEGISAGSGAGGSDLRSSPLHGFWGDADWLFCRDGKWRPVEPGLKPLAHGIPGRVGLLRGYGNAINPHAGAIFIRSFSEAIERIAGAADMAARGLDAELLV